VIPSLARHHRTPRRTRGARMAAPVPSGAVSPGRKASCAARSSVRRLVAYPKSRGLRWSRARSRAAPAAPRARGMGGAPDAPLVKGAGPRGWNAGRAVRTVCSSQPPWSAIRGSGPGSALACGIWQRRRGKAADARRPACTALRSASLNGRT
jgi:hypothetical protein